MLWYVPSPALLPRSHSSKWLIAPCIRKVLIRAKWQQQLISFKHAKLSDEASTVQTTQSARQLKQLQQKAECPLSARLAVRAPPAVKCPFWPVQSGSLCSTLSLPLWKLGGGAVSQMLLGAPHDTALYSVFVRSGRVLGWGWWKACMMLDRGLALLTG